MLFPKAVWQSPAAGLFLASQVIISLVTTCLEAARAKMGSSDGQLESLLTPLLTNILGEVCCRFGGVEGSGMARQPGNM